MPAPGARKSISPPKSSSRLVKGEIRFICRSGCFSLIENASSGRDPD